MKSKNHTIPLLLLDFDEVLNIPLYNPIKQNSQYKWRTKSGWDFNSWSSEIFHDNESSRDFVITTSSDMISSLLGLEEQGLCEIVWLTTWTQHSGKVKTLLSPDDIDSLCDSDDTWHDFGRKYKFLSRIMGKRFSAAGGIGSRNLSYAIAPDDWWKWEAVNRVRDLGFPVVFADDMLSRFSKLYSSEEENDDYLKLIKVNPHMGLTRADFSAIKGFLYSLKS